MFFLFFLKGGKKKVDMSALSKSTSVENHSLLRLKKNQGDQGAGWQTIENFGAENIHMYSLLGLIQQALLESRGIMPATVALSAG